MVITDVIETIPGILNTSEPVDVQIRYRSAAIPATLRKGETPNEWIVCFQSDASAVTPGQSAVIYQNDCIIGGGIIADQRLLKSMLYDTPDTAIILFIAFTANNIAQEQQYRIWFNDKPKSVHSVDEPEKFLSEQAIAHREKQNIPIDSTDLPIDPVRLKKLSELGARILATSKWLNTATIVLTDTADLSAIASLSFVKKHKSLGVAVQPVSNLKKDRNKSNRNPRIPTEMPPCK